jgi:UPF0489 domain
MAASASPPPVPVHVVEDHHEALPFWHLAVRQRRLPPTGVTMVHADAHPDLCCTSGLSAEVMFRPHELYDALDESEGGIAEVGAAAACGMQC